MIPLIITHWHDTTLLRGHFHLFIFSIPPFRSNSPPCLKIVTYLSVQSRNNNSRWFITTRLIYEVRGLLFSLMPKQTHHFLWEPIKHACWMEGGVINFVQFNKIHCHDCRIQVLNKHCKCKEKLKRKKLKKYHKYILLVNEAFRLAFNTIKLIVLLKLYLLISGIDRVDMSVHLEY